MIGNDPLAPTLDVAEWVNTAGPVSIEALRGRVVVLQTFEVLAMDGVSHELRQARALHSQLASQGVAIIGLHTACPSHQALESLALRDFLQDYRFRFPVAIDRAVPQQAIPSTMHAYGLHSAPSLAIIDRAGRIRHRAHGRVEDLQLGIWLGRLLAEVPAPWQAIDAESGLPGRDRRQQALLPAACA